MNKKILLLFLIIGIISVNFVSAERSIPVEVKVSVEFDGDNDFTIFMPNGLEKHYSWLLNETHDDDSFTHIIYHTLDEESWCGNNTAMGEYKALNTKFTEVLDVCIESLEDNQETVKTIGTLEALKKDREIYERDYLQCNERLISLNTVEEELASEKTKYNSCKSSYDNCRLDQSRLNDCEEELESSKKSKTNSIIISLIIGLGGGWLIWGRKPKGNGSPSEQSESGEESGDSINIKSNQSSRPSKKTLQTFEGVGDGPKD